MAKQTSGEKQTVGRVMHAWKHGELESSRGGKVRNGRQAVAIALSESGASTSLAHRTSNRLDRTVGNMHAPNQRSTTAKRHSSRRRGVAR
jgi:hypothetical protein